MCVKHLLEKMSTECLTLAWQEWLPSNTGGSWLTSRVDTLFVLPRLCNVFVLYRIYSNLEKNMLSFRLN